MTRKARVGAHLVSLALILTALILLQGRAEASCALPPQASDHSFTPRHDASPLRDNACTATRQLSGPKPPAEGAAADILPGWLPVDA